MSAAGHEVTPLAVQIDECEVDEAVDDEQPHRREMPVARAREPSAEGHPRGYRIAFEGIAAERLAFSREPGVGVEDLKSAAGHEHDREHVHPVGDAHDPVMASGDLHTTRIWEALRRNGTRNEEVAGTPLRAGVNCHFLVPHSSFRF